MGYFTYIWLMFMVNVGKYTIHGSYGLLINGVYWAYNPLILTIDPNFQRDIQGIFERSTPSWRSVSSAPNAKVHRSLKCGPSKSSQTIGEEGSVMFGQPLCFSLTKVRSVLFFLRTRFELVMCVCVCVCVCVSFFDLRGKLKRVHLGTFVKKILHDIEVSMKYQE